MDLFDADAGTTEVGRWARARTPVFALQVLSLEDLFEQYREARRQGDLVSMRAICEAAGPLADELAGFDYPAAA